MQTEQTTEPRGRIQIETEFIPAISTIKAINDFLFVATGASDVDIEALHGDTMCSLANRCLIEAESVKGLFYELMALYMEKEGEVIVDSENVPVETGEKANLNAQKISNLLRRILDATCDVDAALEGISRIDLMDFTDGDSAPGAISDILCTVALKANGSKIEAISDLEALLGVCASSREAQS